MLEFSRPTREVAGDLGIHVETLQTWLHRARNEGIAMAKAEVSESEVEIRGLRAEIKDKGDGPYWRDEEIAFLRKAASFFAAEKRPKRGSK